MIARLLHWWTGTDANVAREQLEQARRTLHAAGWSVTGDLAADVERLAIAWHDAEIRAIRVVHDLVAPSEPP